MQFPKRQQRVIVSILAALFILVLAGNIFARPKTLNRDEIPDKYKWNLNDIYQSESLWDQSYSEIEGMLPKIKSYEGRLGSSAENLLAYFKLEEEITTKYERLRLYASLSKDLDLRDSKYQEMYERAMNLGNKISSESSFVTPEILDIPEDELWGFLKTNAALKHYKHYLCCRDNGYSRPGKLFCK